MNYVITCTHTKPDRHDQVLNHMGHTWDVHRYYYSQYSKTAERLDVSKILLLQDTKQVDSYKKAGLDEIEVAKLRRTEFTGKMPKMMDSLLGFSWPSRASSVYVYMCALPLAAIALMHD